MKNSAVETIVGAAVIAIAILFFSFVYSTAEIGKGSDGYRLSAAFENAAGVSAGTDVRLSGVKVGTIVDQTLDYETYQAVLTLTVQRGLVLPDDTTAKITSEGLLGATFVALEVGGSDKILKDGDKIENTQGSIDLFGLISEFMNK
ncbi:MAG: outer membrane lipid asymmetry maintenance protein MlaD [Hyphomicrobiales bacterium]